MELRDTLQAEEDLVILYVMAKEQIDEKARRFVDENGLQERVRFLVDPESATIARLGLAKADPEPMETGVPHPATYLLDRDGRIRLIDVREDFHIWLDPRLVSETLAAIP